MAFIASPEVVTAMALAGRLSFNPLTDTLTAPDGERFRLEAPPPAPEVPEAAYAPGVLRPASALSPVCVLIPAAAGAARAGLGGPTRHPSRAIRPGSERLQALSPWPAWDGQDFLDLPVLMKTRGRTTTDHISPAGAWLRFRGHLDRFSDNFLMGATNAFMQKSGRGANVITGEQDVAIAAIARDYHSRGVRWVVVGDANYGEGSSREHAALSWGELPSSREALPGSTRATCRSRACSR